MLEFIDEEIRKERRDVLAKLPRSVRLVSFTEESECPACKQQRKILEETVALTDKLVLANHDRVRDAAEAKRYGIDGENATSIPGPYAAADVSRVHHKQTIIAAGEGAEVASGAYDHLVENGFVSPKAVQDPWQQ